MVLRQDRILEEMEKFNGTTREFYFHIKSIALGKKFDADKQQRLIPEQPRHILKPKERKYVDTLDGSNKRKQMGTVLKLEQLPINHV